MSENRIVELILQPSPSVYLWPEDQIRTREAKNSLKLNIQELHDFPNLHSNVLSLDVGFHHTILVM